MSTSTKEPARAEAASLREQLAAAQIELDAARLARTFGQGLADNTIATLRAELDERTRERDRLKQDNELLEINSARLADDYINGRREVGDLWAERDRLRAALIKIVDSHSATGYPDPIDAADAMWKVARAALAGNEGAGE